MKKILLLMIVFILVGCSSAEEKINSKAMEQIEKGNFTEAAFLLQRAVILNPDYLEGMVNYRNVYPRAVEDTEGKLSLYNTKEDYLKESDTYEDMISLKEGLYNMVPMVHNKLSLSLRIPDYDEIQNLSKDAGISYYNAGNTFEGLKLDRYGRREKFYRYDRGRELYPRYKDIEERREVSLEDARVVVAFTDITGIDELSKVEKNTVPKIKNILLGDEKLSKIIIFKDILDEELKENLRNAGNLSKNKLKDVNTVIKINVDGFILNPTRVTRDYRTRYWTEKYYVTENNVRVARYRERSYIETIYTKQNSSKIQLSYEMIDLEDGKTIGNGSFEGISGDRYRWSVVRGKTPSGVYSGIERDIKSNERIIDEAILNASENLGRDIKNNI